MSNDDLPFGDLDRVIADLPVFPLPGAVLFPRALLPLHIFEPRYRAMLAHCMATNRAMVIARLSEDAELDDQESPRFARIAGLGFVVEHRALPDGRANILLQGRARVSIEEIASADPFRRVRAELIEDLETRVRESDRVALIAAATSFAGELHKHADFTFSVPSGSAEGSIADLCAQHLIFDADVRQAVLEERDVAARVRRVTAELAIQQRALQRETGSALN
jgi:ATP-dependent Lon protease